ncbi:MAG TPA: preprotein translocase subunit SecA [Bacteroidetes bacterium]|nr:preprotein translocase subunit SecA [Bacteroidota bacterium]
MAGFLEGVFNLFGKKNERDRKEVQPRIDLINANDAEYAQLSDEALRNKTNEFRERLDAHLSGIKAEVSELDQKVNQEDLDLDTKEEIFKTIDDLKKKQDESIEVFLKEILPEAFAVMKETSRRFSEADKLRVKATDLDRELAIDADYVSIQNDTAEYKTSWDAAGSMIDWKMIHYDVQLHGGIVLHEGKIAEMQTGEGKTLVSTLPAYLNAIAGLGVHIITVNNYLARRDCEWNRPLFAFLGLTVDCIDLYRPHSPERIQAYKADITYGTNNEFGFDYLRDNMVNSTKEIMQTKLHYAMIDEVDSVLVDDARTPLIISGPIGKSNEQQFHELKPRIQRLIDVQKKDATQYLTSAKKKIAEGNTGYKEGEGGFDLLRAYRAFPKNKPLIKFLSEAGNRQVLQKTENFYLQDQSKEMPTVDEALYFIIEEKQNSIDLTDKGIDLITANGEDREFFVLPDVGIEIAEIEQKKLPEEEELKLKDELMSNFAVKSERLHSINQLLKAYALYERDDQYVVMDEKVKIVDENTGRIMDGRRYSDGLHQAIEAKENVKVEAATQTRATVTLQNFFRMYHKLSGMTGTAITEAGELWDIYKLDVVEIPTNKPIIRDDRNDLVYKTEREKYNAIIEEVKVLTDQKRPVLVGTTSVEISEKLARMLSRQKIKHNVLNAKQHQREAEVVAEAGRPGAVTIATNMAGRGTDIKLSQEVLDAGGLAIIGSERHDSRRVDRQLRGRAGRQGDAGSSQFFISLEDRLMRLFGSERISKVMDRFGYEEGEVIQHNMITKSIERAQRKVEENNFGTRKRLIEYDDVMNLQREVIYTKRRNALFGDRLSVDILDAFYSLADNAIQLYKEEEYNDYEGFKLYCFRMFALNPSVSESEFESSNSEALISSLFEQITEQYKRRTSQIRDNALPVLRRIHAERGEAVKNVVFPVSDGRRQAQVTLKLEEALEENGNAVMTAVERSISLALIDDKWKDHLRTMDDLKQEVRTASYEQKDPLLVYKQEAYQLFENLIIDINENLCSFLAKVNIVGNQEAQQAQQVAPSEKLTASRPSEGGNAQERRKERPKATPVRATKKVGRNEPCPCGSGKKYKQCHGLQS